MFRILKDLLRYNREFAHGAILILLVVAMSLASFYIAGVGTRVPARADPASSSIRTGGPTMKRDERKVALRCAVYTRVSAVASGSRSRLVRARRHLPFLRHRDGRLYLPAAYRDRFEISCGTRYRARSLRCTIGRGHRDHPLGFDGAVAVTTASPGPETSRAGPKNSPINLSAGLSCGAPERP